MMDVNAVGVLLKVFLSDALLLPLAVAVAEGDDHDEEHSNHTSDHCPRDGAGMYGVVIITISGVAHAPSLRVAAVVVAVLSITKVVVAH
jgi:hypothetical protein